MPTAWPSGSCSWACERIAIESYREMVRYFGDRDPTTRRMLEDILAVEEEHADDLNDLLGSDARGGPLNG